MSEIDEDIYLEGGYSDADLHRLNAFNQDGEIEVRNRGYDGDPNEIWDHQEPFS